MRYFMNYQMYVLIVLLLSTFVGSESGEYGNILVIYHRHFRVNDMSMRLYLLRIYFSGIAICVQLESF